jgi:hypothetical protein
MKGLSRNLENRACVSHKFECIYKSDIRRTAENPFRVRIEFVPDFIRDETNPILLSSFVGKIETQEGFTIEPYLRNVWITQISVRQYQKLKSLFLKQDKLTL